jgi:hypothetical protein
MHLNEFSGALVGAGSNNAYTLDKAEQQHQTLKSEKLISYVPRKHFFFFHQIFILVASQQPSKL